MTREEEIKKASIEANSGIAVRPGTRILKECCTLSFQNGAKWADDNPKSPWISVKDDLPCNHKELIRKNGFDTKRVIVVEDGNYHFDRMVFSNNEWDWAYATIPSHWMPIPKLP